MKKSFTRSIRMGIVFGLILTYPMGAFAQLPSYVPSNGLVSFYEFDGNFDALGATQVTLSHVPTQSPPPVFAEDRDNNSNNSFRNFTNTYVRELGSPNLDFQPSEVTISCWIRPDTLITGTFPLIAGNRRLGQPLNSYVLYTSGSTLIFGYSRANQNNRNLNSNTSIPIKTWTHIAATISSTQGTKLYVNGAEVASDNNTGGILYTPNNVLIVGGDGAFNQNNHFQGSIDEVGIWSRPLNPQEIAALTRTKRNCYHTSTINENSNCSRDTVFLHANFAPFPGNNITTYQWFFNGNALTNTGNYSGTNSATLSIANFSDSTIGRYKVRVTSTCGLDSFETSVLEETNIAISDLLVHFPFRTNVQNAVGNGLFGAVGNNTTNIPNRFGTPNSAFLFNGTNSSVQSVTDGRLVLGNGANKTISLWFKRSSLTSKGMLVSYETINLPINNWNPLGIISSTGQLRGYMYQGGPGNPMLSNTTVADTNWHHYALVIGTNTQTMYLDGNAVATLGGVPAPGACDQIFIGNGFANNNIPGVTATGNQPFEGAIDEVRFYNRALTATEINRIFQSNTAISVVSFNRPCANVGDIATLSVITQGAVNYQWQRDLNDITGATSPNVTVPINQFSDLGNYRCMITSKCNATVKDSTNNSSMVIAPVPTPSLSGTPVAVCPNTPVTITVSGGNSYNWGNNLPLTNSVTVNPQGATTYTVLVGGTNGCSRLLSRGINTFPKPGTPFITASGSLLSANLPIGSVSASGYTWLLNNTAFPGTSNAITPTQSGDYRVIASSANGNCPSDTSAAFNFTIAALPSDHPIANVSVFPNPANDHVIIEMEGNNKENLMITLVDATGRIVATKRWESSDNDQMAFGLKQLQAGVYILTLADHDKVNRYKLVIER